MSKTGKTNGEIAEILDVSERHVRSVKKQYFEGGMAALKPKNADAVKVKKNTDTGTGKGSSKDHRRQRSSAVKV